MLQKEDKPLRYSALFTALLEEGKKKRIPAAKGMNNTKQWHAGHSYKRLVIHVHVYHHHGMAPALNAKEPCYTCMEHHRIRTPINIIMLVVAQEPTEQMSLAFPTTLSKTTLSSRKKPTDNSFGA